MVFSNSRTMRSFRGAGHFPPWQACRKRPIKQPTATPTRTVAIMGRFPSLMGSFLTLMGRFPKVPLMGRFHSRNSPAKQPIKKRPIKRFLMNCNMDVIYGDSGETLSRAVPHLFILTGRMN